ncbi:hypothetical protein ACIQU6_30325 [Streptomyces sp. NPDC090442]|uniref:hypothetical protein n=1 Tax=Streptomyces sp. NPDC090442 TaxID=3365962 RepID=UPI0037F1770E
MLTVALVPPPAALGYAGLRTKDALAQAEEFSTIEQSAGTRRTGSSMIQAPVDEHDPARSLAPQAKRRPGQTDASGRAATNDGGGTCPPTAAP